MANVTDPLARPIHGTNPQNLIEYITRQRIYDSQYWKEHLFGCTAADVTEKAVVQLKAVGGSYGGNAKPTRFLSLVLKMLQIQPGDDIIDELISNEHFKYVRVLGAFYLRLTGRPADIYEKLEPLYGDYRRLRYRNPTDWTLMHVDEFIDSLLTEDRVCGIALPRLPKRDVLVEAGYLDGPRENTVGTKFGIKGLELGVGDDDEEVKFHHCKESIIEIEALLKKNAQSGIAQAKDILLKRGHAESSFRKEVKDNEDKIPATNTSSNTIVDLKIQSSEGANHSLPSISHEEKKAKKKKKRKFGSLFKSSAVEKSSATGTGSTRNSGSANKKTSGDAEEESDEYWNIERAKLGLKPLNK